MNWISASDIHSFRHCVRRFWYAHHPPAGLLETDQDPFEALQQEMGSTHEQAVLSHLAQGCQVGVAQSVEQTNELMRSGIEIIYQAQLVDETRRLFGKPDFLFRTDEGDYQAADAKLARSMKTRTGIQIAFYRQLLGNEHQALVFLGDGSVAEVGVEYDTKLEEFLRKAREIVDCEVRPSAHYSVSKCSQCLFHEICKSEFEQEEELSLLYGIHGRSVPALHGAGIETISDLAAREPHTIPDIPHLKRADKKVRAVLQARTWKSGKLSKLKEIELPGGTWVHFDVESNPFNDAGMDHVYLWGLLKPGYGNSDFDYAWSDSIQDDRKAFEEFLGLVEQYRSRWSDLRLIHFSPFERTQLKSYSRRYELRDHPAILWLLDEEHGPLFDIKTAVMDCLILPLGRYGLKDICKHPALVNFQWEDEGSGSQWSIVQYINFLNEKNLEKRKLIKEKILTYNRDDVLATRKLEEWLRSL